MAAIPKMEKSFNTYFRWLLAFSVVANLLMLAPPLHMLQIYDRVLRSGSEATLLYLTLIIFTLMAVGAFSDYTRRLIARRMANRFAVETYDRLLHSLAHDVSGRRSVSRVLGEFNTVRSFLTSRALIGLLDLPFALVFLLIMYAVSIWLGMIVTVGLAVMCALAWANKQTTASGRKASRNAESDVAGFLSLALFRSEEIRAMGMIHALQHRSGLKLLSSLDTGDESHEMASAFSVASRFLRQFLQILVVSLGALLVLTGHLSGGMMFAASMITTRVLSPVDQAIGGWDSIMRALDAYRSVQRVVADAPPPQETVDLPDPKGRITVRDVSYSPGEGAHRARLLDGVSLTIEPGQMVALVGRSGTGKSSLSRILAGAVRPDSGEVRLDGADKDQWGEARWGQAVGYVSQDIELLPATIAENISRFTYAEDSDALIAASQLAEAHDMITALPEGYATMVGRGNFRLSGGQTQRIALARAIYGKPAFLVLDEPDAHLDRDAQKRLLANLRSFKEQGVAIFVISHRERILEAADKIYRLKDGKVERVSGSGSSSSRSSSSSSRSSSKTEPESARTVREEPQEQATASLPVEKAPPVAPALSQINEQLAQIAKRRTAV